MQEGWFTFCDMYFGSDTNKREQATDLNNRVNAELMSYDEFLVELGKLAEIPWQQVQKTLENNPPNMKLLDYIAEKLKPEYKIGMLSNAAGNWLDELFSSQQLRLFNEVVLSYQLGTVKPDPTMYQTISNRLGVLPEECLFVDDLQRYCEAAEQLGMKAIHHQNTTETIAKIEELLGA